MLGIRPTQRIVKRICPILRSPKRPRSAEAKLERHRDCRCVGERRRNLCTEGAKVITGQRVRRTIGLTRRVPHGDFEVVERTNEEEIVNGSFALHRPVVAESTKGTLSPEGAPHRSRHRNGKQLLWSDSRGRYGKTLPRHTCYSNRLRTPRPRRIGVKAACRVRNWRKMETPFQQ